MRKNEPLNTLIECELTKQPCTVRSLCMFLLYGNALLASVLPYRQVPSEGCGNLIERATNCFTNRAL